MLPFAYPFVNFFFYKNFVQGIYACSENLVFDLIYLHFISDVQYKKSSIVLTFKLVIWRAHLIICTRDLCVIQMLVEGLLPPFHRRTSIRQEALIHSVIYFGAIPIRNKDEVINLDGFLNEIKKLLPAFIRGSISPVCTPVIISVR